MGERNPFEVEPGIVKTDAPYASRNRWIDCDKVRFMRGRPEKHRGHERFAGPVDGIARAIKAWDDFSSNRHVVVGTHKKLQHIDNDGVITNITPIRVTGTLTDPFTTTTGSSIVLVTHVSHNVSVGDTVVFSGSNTVGGIFVDGSYEVLEVIDANHYTINDDEVATSDATGGGIPTYEYEVSVGSTNATQGTGYGIGPYGMGFFGASIPSSSFTQYARMWALDLYGENLLALPSGGALYQWDPDTPDVRAVQVANSPNGQFMFVTNERYPVILGAGGDLMRVAWPDQVDITNWTPGGTVTANFRQLKEGSRLIAGGILLGTVSLIWSDTTCYAMQYTGARNIIYTTNPAARQCGLIGPNAFVMVAGRSFWMSNFSFFMYAGSVTHIPRADEIESWLYDRLSKLQNWKAHAHYSSEHNEVMWFYVRDTDTEPAYYAAVCLDDYSWSIGTYDRTAMEEQAGINPRVYGANVAGTIFYHEVGNDADGEPLPWFIESAPVDVNDGNVITDVHGYVPNFQRRSGPVTLTTQSWDQPDDMVVQETDVQDIAEGQSIVDIHLSGRQISMRLSSDALGSDFRLGKQLIEVQKAGRRR